MNNNWSMAGSGIIARLGGWRNIAYHSGLYLIAGVLLLSGISKIIDPMPLIETVKLVFGLPEEILILTATILPIIEIGFGLLIILKIKPKPVLFSTLVLFFAFFAFSVYGTIVGLKNDCGCFGSLVKSEIGWWMVIRNTTFTAISIFTITLNKIVH